MSRRKLGHHYMVLMPVSNADRTWQISNSATPELTLRLSWPIALLWQRPSLGQLATYSLRVKANEQALKLLVRCDAVHLALVEQLWPEALSQTRGARYATFRALLP